MKKEKVNKKRAAAALNEGTINDNGSVEIKEGAQINDDLNEPTMGEKLATLNIVDDNQDKNIESSAPIKPPSADSIHILLKQALHADDRALLIDCLFRQDQKVIMNSVSRLNPSDVLKLLQALVSVIQSRGAVVVCALPWLRTLLLQHASGIISQESSLLALNSVYQLIDSRVSTFHSALQLSNSLNLLFAGTIDEEGDEDATTGPVIYEDRSESDEEEEEEDGGSEDEMETKKDDDTKPFEDFSDASDEEEDDHAMSE